MKLVFAVLVLAVAAQVPPVKNPRTVIIPCDDTSTTNLTCADAKQVTSYEVDIVRTDGSVLQTLNVPAVPPNASNEVRLAVNVQPTAFGTYTFVVRAIAAGVETDNSPASDPWTRAPGTPGKPLVQ